eukprot:TRINITY_DN4231_c0_g1_i1.p1 TRINITY_DN4231_c0_g1~~TRINITY_DN4231_c0_g1_i1.p1  ORF type:complete len:1103 (+),score=254.41 TRINITY_DN4231_c0_g1_i1:73-3381(+)
MGSNSRECTAKRSSAQSPCSGGKGYPGACAACPPQTYQSCAPALQVPELRGSHMKSKAQADDRTKRRLPAPPTVHGACDEMGRPTPYSAEQIARSGNPSLAKELSQPVHPQQPMLQASDLPLGARGSRLPPAPADLPRAARCATNAAHSVEVQTSTDVWTWQGAALPQPASVMMMLVPGEISQCSSSCVAAAQAAMSSSPQPSSIQVSGIARTKLREEQEVHQVQQQELQYRKVEVELDDLPQQELQQQKAGTIQRNNVQKQQERRRQLREHPKQRENENGDRPRRWERRTLREQPQAKEEGHKNTEPAAQMDGVPSVCLREAVPQQEEERPPVEHIQQSLHGQEDESEEEEEIRQREAWKRELRRQWELEEAAQKRQRELRRQRKQEEDQRLKNQRELKRQREHREREERQREIDLRSLRNQRDREEQANLRRQLEFQKQMEEEKQRELQREQEEKEMHRQIECQKQMEQEERQRELELQRQREHEQNESRRQMELRRKQVEQEKQRELELRKQREEEEEALRRQMERRKRMQEEECQLELELRKQREKEEEDYQRQMERRKQREQEQQDELHRLQKRRQVLRQQAEQEEAEFQRQLDLLKQQEMQYEEKLQRQRQLHRRQWRAEEEHVEQGPCIHPAQLAGQRTCHVHEPQRSETTRPQHLPPTPAILTEALQTDSQTHLPQQEQDSELEPDEQIRQTKNDSPGKQCMLTELQSQTAKEQEQHRKPGTAAHAKWNSAISAHRQGKLASVRSRQFDSGSEDGPCSSPPSVPKAQQCLTENVGLGKQLVRKKNKPKPCQPCAPETSTPQPSHASELATTSPELSTAPETVDGPFAPRPRLDNVLLGREAQLQPKFNNGQKALNVEKFSQQDLAAQVAAAVAETLGPLIDSKLLHEQKKHVYEKQVSCCPSSVVSNSSLAGSIACPDSCCRPPQLQPKPESQDHAPSLSQGCAFSLSQRAAPGREVGVGNDAHVHDLELQVSPGDRSVQSFSRSRTVPAGQLQQHEPENQDLAVVSPHEGARNDIVIGTAEVSSAKGVERPYRRSSTVPTEITRPSIATDMISKSPARKRMGHPGRALQMQSLQAKKALLVDSEDDVSNAERP